MNHTATIKIGKKHLGSLDSILFEKNLRAELARDLDLHISTLEVLFVDNQDTTVTFNHRHDNEQARTILNAVIRTYFHLATEASTIRSM